MPEIFSAEQIKCLNAICVPIADEIIRAQGKRAWQYNTDNPEKFKKAVKLYMSSEKGKIACKRRGALRKGRHKAHVVGAKEKEMIRQFYLDRPKDYHIIPLKKGGTHEMANLQYLGVSDNSYKCAKIVTDLSLPPHCPVRWYRKID